jgi:hypothetical protein
MTFWGVAATVSCTLWAGDTVRFSDGTAPPFLPEDAKKEKPRRLGGLLDQDSSLSGVAAPPFSSVLPSSSRSSLKRLTPREREVLDQRKNWMLLGPDDVSLTEKNANRAFGVKEYSLEDLENSSERQKGELERYIEKMDDKNRKPQDKDEARSGADRGGEGGKETRSGGAEQTAATVSSTTMAREMGTVVLSDLPDIRLSSSSSDLGRAPSRELFGQGSVSALFKATPSLLGTKRTPLNPGGELQQGSGADRLGSLLPNLTPGVLDPVNLHPDLTRQEINPVISQSANPATPATKVSFSDSVRGLTAPATLPRAGALEGLNLPVLAPSTFTPSLAPVTEMRKPLSPLVIEIPKRTF